MSAAVGDSQRLSFIKQNAFDCSHSFAKLHNYIDGIFSVHNYRFHFVCVPCSATLQCRRSIAPMPSYGSFRFLARPCALWFAYGTAQRTGANYIVAICAGLAIATSAKPQDRIPQSRSKGHTYNVANTNETIFIFY